LSKLRIKLPRFQREFVWDKEQSAKLIDSILKGFPIGTFIFWKTKEELRSYKEIGNHKLAETPKGDYRNYHYFFPKAYLQEHDPSKEANLLANITLIDGYSNKHLSTI